VWTLSDCRYPEDMGFVNDPDVEITSAGQLAQLLHQYAAGEPRIVILHSDEFGTLQIGIGGKWAGVAHFPNGGGCHTIRPCESARGEWSDYPYFGQPCSLDRDEVFEPAILIDLVAHVYTYKSFPPGVTSDDWLD
jgi:hypothetical protein